MNIIKQELIEFKNVIRESFKERSLAKVNYHFFGVEETTGEIAFVYSCLGLIFALWLLVKLV